MKVTKLEILGYRNIPSLCIDFDEVTVLIGQNNVGKTNILEALSAGLRVNRTIRQGAFELHDYHLGTATSMAGDAGPISISVTFSENTEDEWDDETASAFQDIIVFDKTNPLRMIKLRVTSTAAGLGKEEVYDWTFLDANDVPFRNKYYNMLSRLQVLRPFYYLSTIRDAAREFSKRSTFFAPFISDPDFGDDIRESLLANLETINSIVMASHSSFSVLRDSLNAANAIIRQAENPTKIEAVPSRLSDLLSNTQISFQSKTGATLPVDKQGSGTQSLSVLQLFGAFVAAKMATRYDPLSEPILAIEEPENHLHPSAARLVWSLLLTLPGQKIITSHSGDFLCEVPLSAIRRLKTSADGTLECFKADVSRLSTDEIRHINYHIRRTRGELFFANVWLLVEGKTESGAFPEFAKAQGRDLIPAGVKIVEYSQQGGPEPYIKLADMFGIEWHCLCDGDDTGLQNRDAAARQLNGRNADDCITVLEPGSFESFMCKHGFMSSYEPHIAPQLRPSITAEEGTDAYYAQVSKALIKGRKEEIILRICDDIHENPSRLPQVLVDVITKITSVAT